MRRVASLTLAALTHTALAVEPGQVERSAVVVAVNQPGPGLPALAQGEQHAVELAQTLLGDGGYPKVSTIIGDQASGASVISALKGAVEHTSDAGTLLVVIVSRGAGGDIGEPAFLTHGANIAEPSRTGLSLDAFASALRPRTPDQSIVVLMDASHEEGVGGVALIGPAATDWPDLPEWGLAVTSKRSGVGGREGLLVPALRDALSGEGDRNFDGHVTISELSHYLTTKLEDSGELSMERYGSVAASLVVSSAGRVAPVAAVTDVPVAEPSAAQQPAGRRRPFKLRPVPVAVASAGAIAGFVSLGMYVSKMGECEDLGGKTICGDDEAYRRYRTTQHIMGWTGVGLFAAGVGLQVFPAPDGAMVGVVGSF